MKPPKSKDPVVEKISCDEQGKSLDGGSVRVGNFTPEKLSSTMAEILMDDDWVEMEGSRLNSVLKRAAGHWGCVSSIFYLAKFDFILPLFSYILLRVVCSWVAIFPDPLIFLIARPML